MTTWVVATSPQVSGLVAAAGAVGGPVVAVVVADRRTGDRVATSGVDGVRLVDVPGGVPVEAAAPTVADLVAADPGVVVAGADPASKVLAGAIAARIGAQILTGVASMSAAEGGITVERALWGGIVDASQTWASPVVVLMDAGSDVEDASTPAPVTPVALEALEVTSVERKVSLAEHVDLTSATRIVAVGRGLKDRGDLALIEDLAAALGAQVACSRPLAEGLDWFPKDAYVGVSGVQVAPELYVAIGISGQLQHMAGVRGANTVIAINTDKDAPIFAQSDYGVVGDLYSVVPALTAALKD